MRLDREGGITAEALRGDLEAKGGGSGQGREVDVVEDAIVVLGPQPLVQKGAHDGGTVDAGGFEGIGQLRIVRPEELRQGDGGDALQCRLHRATDGAGVQHVFARVVAPVHARQHKVGPGPVQHVVDRGQHAVGRAAFGGKAARSKLGDHHRVGVADAMPDAGLFERGGDGPDLAARTGDFGGNLGQNLQPRRVDAIVVGDQDAHSGPHFPHPD